MLVFDQLKRSDPHLRALSAMVLAGLGTLLVGLWWIQIVSAREYRETLETQSFRTVRIPAVRGKIIDNSGAVLAENRPTYNVNLYLEDLRKDCDHIYTNLVAIQRRALEQERRRTEQQLGRKLSKQERRKFVITPSQKLMLKQQARFTVASNTVLQVSQLLQRPVMLNPTNFLRHYQARLALPLPVLNDVDSTNVARFQEQMSSLRGVEMDLSSTRHYPFETAAGHLLGMLTPDDSSVEGEEAFFSYRLPDFRGVLGIEYGFDKELRGWAGAKSVQVNNIGYRTAEHFWSPAEPGKNVVLTLDIEVQRAAEKALQSAQGPTTRGAVVVMDVHSGDILALVSSPSVNPNDPVRGYPPGELQRRRDETLKPEFNRATQGNYAPGSVFKLVVGLAALEAGIDPEELVHVAPDPQRPGMGAIWVGPTRRKVRDLAPPGEYNFIRAMYKSSNSYFITNAIRIGPEPIMKLAQRLSLGETIGLKTRQENDGSLPSLRQINSGWTDGQTANFSIGQAPVTVTPLQVAVMISALANGGKVLWPRMVSRIETQDPYATVPPSVFPTGVVRGEVRVGARSIKVLHESMLADTEAPDGTGVPAARRCPGLRICGKTGTAQIQDVRNERIGQTTWFASFAPYGAPRWAVVVMVEDGVSGGGTCSPIAGDIYTALLEREKRLRAAVAAVAKTERGQ